MENNQDLIAAMNRLSDALEYFNSIFKYGNPFTSLSKSVEDLKTTLENK